MKSLFAGQGSLAACAGSFTGRTSYATQLGSKPGIALCARAQVLKLTKGWDVARDHAAKAVSTDTRARAWSADGRTGLLFKCALGTIDLDAPIGATPPRLKTLEPKSPVTNMRMHSWSADGRTGLLFMCALGTTDLDAPINVRPPRNDRS